MPVYGKVIVIRRNGSDGSQFPITNETCVFGRYFFLVITF